MKYNKFNKMPDQKMSLHTSAEKKMCTNLFKWVHHLFQLIMFIYISKNHLCIRYTHSKTYCTSILFLSTNIQRKNINFESKNGDVSLAANVNTFKKNSISMKFTLYPALMPFEGILSFYVSVKTKQFRL